MYHLVHSLSIVVFKPVTVKYTMFFFSSLFPTWLLVIFYKLNSGILLHWYMDTRGVSHLWTVCRIHVEHLSGGRMLAEFPDRPKWVSSTSVIKYCECPSLDHDLRTLQHNFKHETALLQYFECFELIRTWCLLCTAACCLLFLLLSSFTH